ncbi:MAG: tetratricopeptide repeat protein, partial [Tannerella sp.]|nr:tetratricopeptide repeat protein [Tannerella sp.]
MNKIVWLACVLLAVYPDRPCAQSYEDMIRKSYEYVDGNDLPAAEECLKAAMRLEPANRFNYALLTNLGTIQRRQRKYDDALISYSAALSQRATDKLILRNRAELYTEMGETGKAILDYQMLISVEPRDEDALYHRGLLYLQSENFLLAEADFEKIVEINPETVWGRLGYAVLEKGRGNFSDSEMILNYLINKYPQYMRLFEERAELYYLMGRNGRARSDLNRVFAGTA